MPAVGSGWDITGSAAGSPLPFLLWIELFGSSEGGGSLLTSDGLPKQWPRDEQGSPCMFADAEMTRRHQMDVISHEEWVK